MDIDAYISSGVLENYCLGFCSAEENALIEANVKTYPQISKEIEKIRSSLEEHLLTKQVQPSAAVKVGVMLAIYKEMAAADDNYPPFINDQADRTILSSWISDKTIIDPGQDYDNLFMTELPSTEQVTNFIVHAKAGHETEMHEDFIEYLFIIKGSCTMNFEGVISSYKEGDIIQIDKHINHTATVTSSQPMIALVQRQACA